MIDYKPGFWGWERIFGVRGSAFPRALIFASSNAAIAFALSTYIQVTDDATELADHAFSLWAGFSSVLFYILYTRGNVAYNRWWEGGTLLQQTRGEWFNSYSSLIAFTSLDPKKANEVEEYQHMLARLMSLLFCSALQQVSPQRDRPFEVLDTTGLDAKSIEFLKETNDRVEVILQWVQRSTVLNMSSGVLPIPPPVMSRAFQEISRGIVNLQNARKIADFPFPWPLAQASIVMLLVHWAVCPVVIAYLLPSRLLATGTAFITVFFLWSCHFIAMDLESPFGTNANDLPMDQMQADWNTSVATLLAGRANTPPTFVFEPEYHRKLVLALSHGVEAQPSPTARTAWRFKKPPPCLMRKSVVEHMPSGWNPMERRRSGEQMKPRRPSIQLPCNVDLGVSSAELAEKQARDIESLAALAAKTKAAQADGEKSSDSDSSDSSLEDDSPREDPCSSVEPGSPPNVNQPADQPAAQPAAGREGDSVKPSLAAGPTRLSGEPKNGICISDTEVTELNGNHHSQAHLAGASLQRQAPPDSTQEPCHDPVPGTLPG